MNEIMFLVRAKEYLISYKGRWHADPTEHNGTQHLTKNKIYLVMRVSSEFYTIAENDFGGKLPGYYKNHFKKLEFIDIWEMKRENDK